MLGDSQTPRGRAERYPLTRALAVPEGLPLQAASGMDDLEAANEVLQGRLECGNHGAAPNAPDGLMACILQSLATANARLYPVCCMGRAPPQSLHLHGRGGGH